MINWKQMSVFIAVLHFLSTSMAQEKAVDSTNATPLLTPPTMMQQKNTRTAVNPWTRETQQDSITGKNETPTKETAATELTIPPTPEVVDSVLKAPQEQTSVLSRQVYVSVLPLRGDSSIKELLPVFTDVFRKELTETGKFKILAHEMMEQIIRERDFQSSDMCDEPICMAEAGKIFGVSQIVSGSVVKTENNNYVVTAKLIDVSNGTILEQGSEQLQGDSYDAIKQILKKLASVLAGKQNISPQTFSAPVVPKPAISTDSEPASSVANTSLKTDSVLPGQVYISVLPLQGDNSLKELLPVFTDIFRKELVETGKFKVMAREMMEQIIQEREFQLSDMCEESSCMAVAGKIIGVSQIVAGSVVHTGKNSYAVTVKLVDVATGSTVQQANEKLSGDMYIVIKGMLKSLAGVLAGTKNNDHIIVENIEKQNIRENRYENRIEAARFSASVRVDGLYPVHILQMDDYKVIKKYVDSDPNAASQYKITPDKFSLGATMQLQYNMNPRFSLSLEGGFFSAPVSKKELIIVADHIIDTTINANHYYYRGPLTGYSTRWQSYSLYCVGLGPLVQLIKKPRVSLSIELIPSYAYVKYTMTRLDSNFYNLASYVNQTYVEQLQHYEESVQKAVLHGNLFGGRAGVSVKFFPLHWFGILASGSLQMLIAPSLEGKNTVSSISIDNDPDNPNVQDTSYTENAAIMRGNWLGSGEYLSVRNPSIQYTGSDDLPISTEKSWVEFSSLKFSIGVMVLF